MKQAKAFIGLAVIVIGFYLAWKVMPAFYANMEYQDYVESQARIESYSPHNADEIADIYAKKAAELDLPLQASDIHVTKVGTELTIWAEYDVPVDVPIHPFSLHFRVETQNHRI